MAQTKEGAMKLAASRRGMTVGEYRAKLEAGEKWCTKGKHWALRSGFGVDTYRADGLASECLACRRVAVRKDMKGKPSAMKGKQFPADVRLRMGTKKGSPSPRKGIPRSLVERARISASLRTSPNVARGDQCHSYKDGKTAERRDLRFTMQYKRWRYDVYQRDKFTCQECATARGGNLVAHHIKPFADFPELRFEVSNGLTLCETCHDALHYGK